MAASGKINSAMPPPDDPGLAPWASAGGAEIAAPPTAARQNWKTRREHFIGFSFQLFQIALTLAFQKHGSKLAMFVRSGCAGLYPRPGPG
jgi:hypothetical protein